MRVDGVLDEPMWSEAARLGPLTQVEPVEGAEPTYATDVRLAYDADFFYIGIVCHDDPAQVRARQMDRDANIQYDDVVEMWFDTFHDQRFAYWFQITPGGSRGDALLADNGSSFNKSWDGIWYGRSRVTEQGWVAELALPFKTLAFLDGETTWGFNLERKRVANGEESRWASPFVAYRSWNLSEGGELVGMTGMHQGYGLDIVPYVKGGVGRDHEADEGYDPDYDVGLDVAWRPTASTNLRLTVNTDFAETEVDQRQVNLTRFPLFFPEKRDFFLEDAGVFEFGPPRGFRGRPSIVPFFSRTIGRDEEGNAVPILGGLKFTGRAGDWNIGFLDTQVDAYELEDEDVEVPQRNLGAMRISRNLGGENSVGMIMTHGDPDSDRKAWTAGADFRLGSSRLFGEGRSGALWGYWLGTGAEGGGGEGQAFGLRATTSSSTWGHRIETFSIDDGFEPALGFVRRTGVNRYNYQARYTWRGEEGDAFRQYTWRVTPQFDEDRTGSEDAWRVPMEWFEVEFWSEDKVSFQTTFLGETLEEGFDLSDDVFVSPGDYDDLTRHELEFDSNDRRRFFARASVEWGDFFSGDIVRMGFSPIVVPSGHVRWALDIADVRAQLDEGDFDTTIYGANADFSFDPDLSWKNFLQFDTESENLSWQSRLHWIVKPGQDLFVVGLWGWDRMDRESFARTDEELTIKLSYTWRF